jgi:hypothetical protein
MNNIISLDIDKKCICRYNNFILCDRNIYETEYCRYHKNTKKGYIHKIFYNVFKDKKEININDLYELYKHVNSINYSYVKELYIELLQNIPYKMICNILDNSNYNIFRKNNYSSKMEKYIILYEINKNTYDLENNNKYISSLIKIQKKFKDKQIIKYDPTDDTYMNNEELFTGENICEIPNDRLFILKNSRGEKYIFDAIELEYFIRTCINNKQEPYNPYTRDLLDISIINSLRNFIKYHNLQIKGNEYKWTTSMHAFTDLAIEIERRGFYNSPEWFKPLTNVDLLKIIKYFKLFSSNIPENVTYFNNITEENLIYDFCKDAIKMFRECNEELYILCCNFIKSVAMCSNHFYENMPGWLIGSPRGLNITTSNNIANIRINTNIETLLGMINRNSLNELENNFLLYYYVEHI